jgi:hypothetical protein
MSWRADISRNVQQLRFFYDSANPQSAGLRTFVEKNYYELKVRRVHAVFCRSRFSRR